jgi:hypothetical protein
MARKKKAPRQKAEAKRKPAAPGWHTGWSNLPEWQQHAVCLVLLLALSIGFFSPIHFSDKRIVGGDTVQWQASAQAMLEYQEQTGRPALWDPNMFGGMPGYKITYAPVVPQVDDVLRMLRKVIWPTSHFIFLLIGTYLLVVFLTGDKLSGLLAACAYGLTTYLPILLTAGHNSKFIALCLAPWLVLAFAYALRRPTLLAALLFATHRPLGNDFTIWRSRERNPSSCRERPVAPGRAVQPNSS